jgi:hypothetical protein
VAAAAGRGAASFSFVWHVHPERVAGRVDEFSEAVVAALHSLADLFAAKIQAYAQQNAPWGDVTGAARAGLRGTAEKLAAGMVLRLAHSVYYGVFLELGTSRMGPRPIVQPALEAHYAEVIAAVTRMLAEL